MDTPLLTLVGIPNDQHSSHLRGAALAPPLIREAFHCPSSNTWSEQDLDLGEPGLLHDLGDLCFPDSQDPWPIITHNVSQALDLGRPLLILGGDHAITHPVLRGFQRDGEKLSILHFDAHPDLYDALDGDRRSHACPFARIMEEGLAHRLVQVGIRGMNGHQRQQAQRFGVEVHEMRDWNGLFELTFDGPLYVSFDLDALDPAFAPGVSHLEPGGLSVREALSLIQRLEAPAIVGADIVELNPQRDPTGVTAMVAAKLMRELAAKMIQTSL